MLGFLSFTVLTLFLAVLFGCPEEGSCGTIVYHPISLRGPPCSPAPRWSAPSPFSLPRRTGTLWAPMGSPCGTRWGVWSPVLAQPLGASPIPHSSPRTALAILVLLQVIGNHVGGSLMVPGLLLIYRPDWNTTMVETFAAATPSSPSTSNNTVSPSPTLWRSFLSLFSLGKSGVQIYLL